MDNTNEPKVIITLDWYNTLLASHKAQEQVTEMNKEIFVKHMQVLIPAIQNRLTGYRFMINWASINFNRTPMSVKYDPAKNELTFLYEN